MGNVYMHITQYLQSTYNDGTFIKYFQCHREVIIKVWIVHCVQFSFTAYKRVYKRQTINYNSRELFGYCLFINDYVEQCEALRWMMMVFFKWIYAIDIHSVARAIRLVNWNNKVNSIIYGNNSHVKFLKTFNLFFL